MADKKGIRQISDNPESTDSFPGNFSVILHQVQAGNSRAENHLHREFVGRLVQVASKRINERYRAKIDAEEVVQSVFASFFRRHRNQEFEFFGWNDLWALLLKITVHKCADRVGEFRTQKRDVSREIAPTGDGEFEPAWLIPANVPASEEIAIFEETLDRLLDQLTESQRKIVLLRLQGMSNLEISQLIGRTERTVYRMLTQIRQQFSEMNP